uniref:Uncharacterized protein n=1 Tax=viral metagenome TaxID=1070528 RepID=A0A6M3K8N6_9ZZZZ
MTKEEIEFYADLKVVWEEYRLSCQMLEVLEKFKEVLYITYMEDGDVNNLCSNFEHRDMEVDSDTTRIPS